jgi:hypothetical protein
MPEGMTVSKRRMKTRSEIILNVDSFVSFQKPENRERLKGT